MTMHLITFSDYDGRYVTVPAAQIESIRRPSGRVHDHGGLVLLSGRSYGFNSDSTAERIERELAGDDPQQRVAELRELVDSVVAARVAVWETLKALGEPIRDTDTDLVAAVTRYVERANAAARTLDKG